VVPVEREAAEVLAALAVPVVAEVLVVPAVQEVPVVAEVLVVLAVPVVAEVLAIAEVPVVVVALAVQAVSGAMVEPVAKVVQVVARCRTLCQRFPRVVGIHAHSPQGEACCAGGVTLRASLATTPRRARVFRPQYMGSHRA